MLKPCQIIGRCIYCDSTQPPLTREHVIPQGLGGRQAPVGAHEAFVLGQAVCEDCREITLKFEAKCLDEIFGQLRNIIGSVRKNRKTKKNWIPKKISALIKKGDGSVVRIVGEPRDFPCALRLPLFAEQAGMFLPANAERQPVKSYISRSISKPDPASPIYNKELAAKAVGMRHDIDVVAYQRLLAKIAHGVAVAAYGLDGFVSLLRPFILGNENGFGKYIAGQNLKDERPRFSAGGEKDIEHSFYWVEQEILATTYVVVFVRLFANYGAPTNAVFAGTVKNNSPKPAPV